jgi:hypothetical protein
MRRVFILIAVLAIGLSSSLVAQQGTADLRGRVVDDQGSAMPGVTVIVRNQETGLFRESTSGADGSFFFNGVVPGVYAVEATLQGFKTYQRADVRLEVGRATTIDVAMALGGVAESVTVRGEAPLVDTTSKEIGGHIGTQEITETPSFSRNFTAILGTLPGVVSSFAAGTFGSNNISAGGQAANNVSYSLDGSNNNDGRSAGGSGSQVRVAMETVQEFKFVTSQFDAEYGTASGGIVNAVSKQGTNQFHGSAFGFFQDESLTSRDYFARANDLTEAPSKQQQFGGTLGGPILRDRAHFFFGVERILFDQVYTTEIPSRPDLSRSDVQISRIWNTFLRLDHQLTPGNTWGVRWMRDYSPQPVQLNPMWTRSAAGAEIDTDQTVVGTLSSVIGNTRVNTLKSGWISEQILFANPNFNGNGHDQKSLLPTLAYASFVDQQNEVARTRDIQAYNVDDVFSWFVPNRAGGDHELKFGVSYLYSTYGLQQWDTQNGRFNFSHNLPFNPADPRTYPERFSIRVPTEIDFDMRGHYVGMFAQDKWKIGDRLTLNIGARYDIEMVRTPNGDNPLFAGDGGDYPLDLDNVAPRFGFTYALDGGGRSSIRAGAGLFYQSTSFQFLQPIFTDGRNATSFLVQFPLDNIDPGPRNGQFPTDPRLVNGPVVDHAAIDALFPPGSTQRNLGVVTFDNPDRRVPFARHYSVGYQTQVGETMALTVDVVRSESRDQYLVQDLNPGVRNSDLATGSVTRTNPLVGAVGEFATRVNTMINGGEIDYTSLQLSGTKRFSAGYSARVSYAFSKGTGNTGAGQRDVINSQLLADLRLDSERGPTDVDRPHILSVSGTWDVPRSAGLKISGVLQARSGTPFSLINSTFDRDRNGITTNEYLAPGTYSGTGNDAVTIDYDGGRNGARGPNYVSLDLRGGYRFGLPGGRSLDASIDVFNVTNRDNFTNPSGDQRLSATFLRLTGVTGATRSAQLNVRFGF